MTMMDRLHREAFTYVDKYMDAILRNTTSTEKEREEASATKKIIGKELAKEYMKGFGGDTYIDGHRKTTWKENSPGHLRHHKQQGRRHSLLAEIERSRYRIPSERIHKGLRVREVAEGQRSKGITGTQEFKTIAKKLGLQLHLYGTLDALEEAVLIQIKGADTLYINKEMTRKAEHLRKWRRDIREVSGALRWMKRKTEAPAGWCQALKQGEG